MAKGDYSKGLKRGTHVVREIEYGKPIPDSIQQYLYKGTYRLKPVPESLDESGSVTKTEVLWAATRSQYEKVDVTECPSRLAISLWQFAREDSGRFHSQYASKLLERPAPGGVESGGGNGTYVDPAVVKEAEGFQRIGREFIGSWESAKAEDGC